MTDRSNEPAYPIVQDINKQTCTSEGMTIREKIAAQNLAALYGAMTMLPIDRQQGACGIWHEKYGETTLGRAMALDSIELADCLIAELSKQPENKMELKDIYSMPLVLDNIHESSFRSYHILEKVLGMVDRGDSKEAIVEVANFLKEYVIPEK